MTDTILYTTALVQRERRNRALVRGWLYVICLLVLAMVMVGGATRLTDSGLSITEWQPIHGIIPPLSHDAWLEEFAKYKLIPEYERINRGMSLTQFQFIYWWEWAHRFLGRIVGFVFLVPLVVFWWTGRLEARLKPRLVLLFLLGGLQGAIGWWMVASGLVDRVDVSQYRLAVHLTLACIIFAYALWVARGLAPHAGGDATLATRLLAPVVVMLVLLQIFIGGLVAGLDAGLAFNDWPLMDGAAVPSGLLLLEPAWRNLFENPKTVQFIHRLTGYGVWLVVLAAWYIASRSRTDVTHVRRAAIMVVLVSLQAAIGIATLVMQVPLSWALAHQAGAVVVLGFAVAHWRALAGPYPPVTAIEVRG
ncbi:MAG: COX15/CtaA family protein [Pseudomonadota bacterium]|nr:COX15/CtaA family protein [Pseudomonadota bacterium]